MQPVSVLRWRMLNSPEKMEISKYVPGCDLGVVFPPVRHQRNRSGWYENSTRWTNEFRLVPKHWSAWVWKSFANISLAIKEFLRIENGNLYANYQMNKSIKNQIYPKINHNTSPWADCTIRQSGCHQNSYCCYHTTWETNRYANQLTSPGFQ